MVISLKDYFYCYFEMDMKCIWEGKCCFYIIEVEDKFIELVFMFFNENIIV